jgi:uncharacterized protein
MIIKIAGLADGVHRLEFDEPISKVGLEEPFYGNFRLDAELTKTRNQVILNAGLTLNANFDCDRCSTEYNSVIKTSFQMVYIFGRVPEVNEDVNVVYLPPETDKINLSNEMKDYSILAIPMKKLCKEDCKGLCPRCGKDLNEGNCNCSFDETDSRWLPLQDLKNKLNNNN